MANMLIFYLMPKICILVVFAGLVVLIGGTTGNNYNLIYAQNSGMTIPKTGITNFSADGTVSSGVGKFILVGPWALNVTNGNISFFAANITAFHPDGSNLHNHLFSGFHQTAGTKAKLDGNNTVSIGGFMDIGLNRKTNEWAQVPTIISIKNGTALSIILNDFSKVYLRPPEGPSTTAFVHFTDPSTHLYNAHTGSQPVYGLVKHLTRTSTITH